MTSSAKWTIVSLCLTVLAVLVPWAHYGDIDVELSYLPLWWTYLGAAVVLHGCALLPARVGLLFAAVVLAAAVFVMTGYDDGSAILGHVVPAVRPRPGLGVVFAVASVAAQVAGLRAKARDARPVPA